MEYLKFSLAYVMYTLNDSGHIIIEYKPNGWQMEA